jgi:UDP-N-acetylglucosamine 2-epimerase (non-hydrolysing)
VALRDKFERPETITIGTHQLIGTDPTKLHPALARLMAGQWKKGAIPSLWDGRAAERIVVCMKRVLSHSLLHDLKSDPTATHFMTPLVHG